MLIKQKIAVALTALSLMSMAAIAPMASAYPINDNPYVELQDDEVAAGDLVLFDVWDVRDGCQVTTKLSSKKVTNKAVTVEDEDFPLRGAIEDAEIKAPKVAGIYRITSIVSNKCKSDSGHKSSDTLYVGEGLYFDGDSEDVADGNLATRVYGNVEDWNGLSQDLGLTKVLFYKGSKLVAKGTTDADGYVSVILPSKTFKGPGDVDLTVKVANNGEFYMDNEDDANVLTITVDPIAAP